MYLRVDNGKDQKAWVQHFWNNSRINATVLPSKTENGKGNQARFEVLFEGSLAYLEEQGLQVREICQWTILWYFQELFSTLVLIHSQIHGTLITCEMLAICLWNWSEDENICYLAFIPCLVTV
jgi:hypothetical protein